MDNFWTQLLAWLSEHWVEFVVSGLSLAFGAWFGQRRARKQWQQKEFLDRLNVSLNILRDGKLKIRTLQEETLDTILLNKVAVNIVDSASRKTTPENPLLELPEDQAWFILNGVLNSISEQFAEGYVKMDLGLPLTVAKYTVCLTSEAAGEARTRKVRAMLVQTHLYDEIENNEFEVERDLHNTRIKTLRQLAKLRRQKPYLFIDMELAF